MVQVNGTRYAEVDMLRIFLGTCQAVRAMHQYHSGPTRATEATEAAPGSSTMVYPPGPTEDDQAEEEDQEEEDRIVNRQDSEHAALIGGLTLDARQEAEENGQDMPGLEDDGGIVLGKLSSGTTGSSKKHSLQPWAHRDIKPVSTRFQGHIARSGSSL